MYIENDEDNKDFYFEDDSLPNTLEISWNVVFQRVVVDVSVLTLIVPVWWLSDDMFCIFLV